MASQILQIVIEAIDKSSNILQGIEKKVDGFKSSIEESSKASQQFAKGLTAVGVAVGGLGVYAIKSAGQFEQTMIAFETMLGSAEKAQKLTADLIDFAKKTPFELSGLEQATKQLLAYGIESDNMIPTLRMLGDVSAGLNVPVQQIAYAFGQVKSATYLTGQELRQFMNAGVPLLTILSEMFGKTTQEIKKMVEAGEISFDDVEEAFKRMTGEGGRFNNLMEKQSSSLLGMVSNLKDAWDQMLREQGAQLLEWAKQFIDLLIDIVTNKIPAWIEITKQVIDWLSEHKSVLIIVAGAITGALVPAIISAIASFATLAITLAPWMLAGALIAGLVAGIWWLVKNWDEVVAKISEVVGNLVDALVTRWNMIKTGFMNFIASIKQAIDNFTKPIKDAWTALWESVKTVALDAWESVKNAMASGVNWIIDRINSVINTFNSVASKAVSWTGMNAPQMSTIPQLASGGIVTRPTLAMIGEAGAEAVIPLNRAGGFGTINLYITGNTIMADDDRIAEKFGDQIIKRLKMFSNL